MHEEVKTQLLRKLIAIQQANLLGELLERFSYARRDVPDMDPLSLVHAELDAANIGKTAGHLLSLDPDEMAEVALEEIAPNRLRQLGKNLIDELHDEIKYAGQPEPKPQATEPEGSKTDKERKW